MDVELVQIFRNADQAGISLRRVAQALGVPAEDWRAIEKQLDLEAGRTRPREVEVVARRSALGRLLTPRRRAAS